MPIISAFKHFTGFHCGTTSIRAILNFYGHSISEPMALGIGQGLFAAHLINKTFSPSHGIRIRSSDLESTAFRGFGVDVDLRKTNDSYEAWQWVKQTIDGGEPVMLQSNLPELPYYKTDTRFAGHKIIVFGYDDAAGTVLISDNEFKEPQTISQNQLAKARVLPQPPYYLENNWFKIRVPKKLTPMEKAIPFALRGLVKRMLEGNENEGIRALYSLSEKITDWKQAKDWSWCTRFTYQLIERRGSGGGAFRLQYANFLEEATQYVPSIKSLGLADLMRRSAATWTELAFLLKEISDRDTPSGFSRAKPLLRQIADLEQELFSKTLQI